MGVQSYLTDCLVIGFGYPCSEQFVAKEKRWEIETREVWWISVGDVDSPGDGQ
jgi:hypothetical protein